MLRKILVSMLAIGGLVVANPQAQATVVFQDDVMTDGGLNLGVTELFTFGGPQTLSAVDSVDGNQFAIFDKNGSQNAGMGISQHTAIADVTAVQPLVDGMTLRVSAWFVSDPLAPWTTQSAQGWKFEFYNTALGAVNTIDMTNETENGFGLGLVDATSTITTTGWTQTSMTVPITNTLVDFASLQEIRPVLFTGDFTGLDTDGRMFVDGFVFEVFPDLATANATPLPANTPGGFNPVDLSGDINGDGFVGLADLNIVLGTWNNGVLPPAGNATFPEPASLAFLGMGALAVLRRR